MTSKYVTRDGAYTVEVITLTRERARQCFKVTDRHGVHVKDCATLEELAAILNVAELEPAD